MGGAAAVTTSEAHCYAVEGAGVTNEGGGVLMQSGKQRHRSDRRRWRRAQTKEAAITAAKDRSKGDLWLKQHREDALCRQEGAGAMTADETGSHDEGGAAGGCWSRDGWWCRRRRGAKWRQSQLRRTAGAGSIG